MDKLVNGKVILLTGAAGGIGAASAITFAKEGAKAIYICDIAEEKAQATIAEIKRYCECTFIKADVTDSENTIAVFEQIKREHGRLDVCVCCAGITSVGTVVDFDLAKWDLIMDINLKGALLYSRESAKMMMEQKSGHIILFSSISGQVGGIRTNPAYACSKAGVSCLTKSVAKTAASCGVTCNAVAPGIAVTDMTTKTEGFKYSDSEVPMGYACQPQTVADLVLFLGSNLSDYITGQTISVNGGMFMGF